MMKRPLSCGVLLVCCWFAFAAAQEEGMAARGVTVTPAGEFPIVEEPVTLEVLTTRNNWGAVKSFDEIWVLNWYEELTGVDVNWQVVLQDAAQKVNLMLASQTDLPDVFVHNFSQDQILLYGSQGLFVPLNEMIDELGYGIKKTFEYDPDVKRKITAPDGNIYAFFNTTESSHGDFGQKMWINQQWLDNLGLEMPTTTEEYYQVLKAFKEHDANGNGDPNDEIPLSGMGFNGFAELDGFLINPFTTSPSLKRAVLEDGRVTVPFVKPEYREGLRYLKRLWDDGLVDNEIFVQDWSQIKSTSEHPDGARIGSIPAMHVGWLDLSKDTKLQYTWLEPLRGPSGLRQAPYYIPGIGFTMTITSVSEIPEVAFRWAEGFYLRASNGGIYEDVGFWEFEGVAGVGYRLAEPGEVGIDGKPAVWSRYPLGKSKENGGVRNAWNWYSTGYYKTSLVDTGAWAHEKILLHGTWAYDKYRVDNLVPPLFMDAADAIERAELEVTLYDYARGSVVKFITGALDLDEDWDAYLSELEKIGLPRYLELLQKGYEDQWM